MAHGLSSVFKTREDILILMGEGDCQEVTTSHTPQIQKEATLWVFADMPVRTALDSARYRWFIVQATSLGNRRISITWMMLRKFS
jgi:hypothetical protein